MIVLQQRPAQTLVEFVDYYWYMEGYRPPHSRELALPDGSIEWIFDLRGAPIRLYDRRSKLHVFQSAVLCGPHSDFFVIDTAGEAKVAGIHFKPGGLRPFVDSPLCDLLNGLLSPDDVWGGRAALLHEELLAAGGPGDMFGALERELLSLVRRPLCRSREVEFVRSRLHGCQVRQAAGQLSISHRWLNHKFKQEIGLTPKQLSRLMRFQQALQRMNGDAPASWVDIAHECGYYDQSHFIKDFQAYSGINPTEYRPIAGRHRNHAGAEAGSFQ